ncbi:MAG: polyketide antibiotic transporter [Actinobacteria bacterium]|nr:polyketide antibiotic transporter [Actinomycetota bacterium]
MTSVASRSMIESNVDVEGEAGRTDSLAGLGILIRLVLRRDRIRMLLWFVGIVGLVVATAASITGVYNTPAQLEQYAQIVRGNSALIVQAGPGYGLDDPTTGAVMMNEVGIWTLIAVALMSVFMTVRHTRTEEETERAELVRAAPVGRHAQLMATMVGVTVANVLVAAGVVVSLLLYDLPAVGSIAFGLAIIGSGLVFAGVAAVGDGWLSWLTWLSPPGWGQAIRAFADERWWVLVLPLVAASALVYVAIQLQNRRDFGSGMIPQRPGRADASPWLAGPLGLAVRLQRATVIGWTVGVGLIGFFYGIVADEAESIVEDSPEMAEFFAALGESSITDAFLATAVLMLALVATGFTISSVLRLRSEELAGRADPILATPTSRRRWVLSHLAVAVGGTVIIMVVTGLATGVGFALASGDFGKVPSILGAALVMIPAMLVLGAFAMMLYGFSPRWAPFAWAGFAWAIVAGLFGTVIDIPEWALDISPFGHVPAIPASSFELLPVMLLCTIAVALTWVGLVAITRRDIQ